MKRLIIFLVLIFVLKTINAQFTGTDSLRNYNNKYITNNPATAFTNLRLNTLLRGMIDWIDTARAGTGGGGALGVDTLYALNDSTIRYRKSGVFHNTVLKGVYDTRKKVDTIYKTNDSTLNFTINGIVRSLILPGNIGATQLTDSSFIVGSDTITIRGTGAAADSTVFSTNYRRDTAIANIRDELAGKQPIGNYITALTGDVTASGPGSVAATIAANAVTDSKLRQSAGLSVIGRSANSTGNVADITAGTDNQVLRRSGTSLGFGAVNLASSNAVTGNLPVANGGTGTSTPGLVAGTNITITGTWPNQTINSSGGGGATQGIDSVLRVGRVDTATTFQFGYPQGGFVQSIQQSPSDTLWDGAPIVLYPFRGSDTAITNPRVFTLFGIRTHRYDVTQPANVILSMLKVGEEAIGKRYMRVGGLEWDWYGNYEYHPIEMKVDGAASAVRMQSCTMLSSTGLSTWTQRATQHIFSDISDNQMFSLNRGLSTWTASGVSQPTLQLLTQSTDGTNSGLTIATEAGQTVYGWHPSAGSFQVATFDLPYQWITGTSRGINSSDPEYDMRFSNRLANNRMLQFKNGSRILGVLETDQDSLYSWAFGGDHILAHGSYSVVAKSLRNNHQKPFAIPIMTDAADTAVWKLPFAIDTVGRIAVNLPSANSVWSDGLLGRTETEDFRVYGKSSVIDNTAGLNRLLTLYNTDGGNFSGPSLKFFNDVGTGGTNGYGLEFYSSNTSSPYNSAMVFRNYDGGDHVFYGQSAELARFGDNGHFKLASYGSGSITGTPAYTLAVDASGNVIETSSGGGITSINGETGASQTIAAGTGIAVNSSSNTHTISIPTSFITTGTYTPTLTGVTNVTSTTAYQCKYTRVGDMVTVTGRFFVDFTSTGATEVGISLPISSNLASTDDLTGCSSTGVNPGGIFMGDITNDRASFQITTSSSSGYDYYFTFTYQIL